VPARIWPAWSSSRIGLPHATRLAVIRRDVDLAGQPLSKEIAFVATSRGDPTAAEISARARRHWGTENLEHRPRDTVWREDDQQAHHGNGPRAMATQPGPRPVRHPRHRQDQTDRPPQSAATRSAPSH
jgi:hypothetical protein